MLARSRHPAPSAKIKKIANAFRFFGWLSLWVELGLAFASILILLFAVSGRKFSPDSNTGIGIGIFWAVCSFLVLCATIFFAFRYTRIAKGLLREPDAHLHPRKTNTMANTVDSPVHLCRGGKQESDFSRSQSIQS